MNPFSGAFFDLLAAQGYAVHDNFLSEQDCRAWSQWLEDQNHNLQPAQTGFGPQKQLTPNIRGDSILWLSTGESNTAIPQQAKEKLEGLRRQLNLEMRMGLKWVEAHFAQYPVGASYHRHLDQAPGRGHRQLTFVLYLNPDWLESDGGELEIYEGSKSLCRILPLGGRLVLFQSARFPHEVRPGKNPRKSLTGWFRDDDPVVGR